MKWVFYLVLAANAAFFSWELKRLEPPPPPGSGEPPVAAHVNRLLLLSEIDMSELRERNFVPAQMPVPLATDPGPIADTSSPPAADRPAPAPEPVSVASLVPDVESTAPAEPANPTHGYPSPLLSPAA